MAIKGITVKVGADTKGLNKALKDIRSQSRKIGRELYKVNRSLKFNPDSVELWAQKQDILTERVEQTKEKLDVLKQAEKDMQKQYKSGDIGEKEYREYRRELIKTKDQLSSFQDELEKTQRKASDFSRKMQKAADDMEKFGNRMKGIGDNLNTHVTMPLAAAFTALTVGTRNFRKEISVLKNNADTAGVSMEELDGKMAQLNAVTGELDSNVEGLSSILAAGFRDEQLTGIVNELSGAVTKFPDTLKFENLSESLQETIGSGKSVGQFDEMLSRLGINLDNFNEGLQTAKENGRATDYVLQTLANNGLAASYDQYAKNNEALVESAEAHYELQSSLAELGAELEPILTDIIEGTTDVVDVFNDLSEEQQDMILFGAAITAALGPALTIMGNLSLTVSSLTSAIASAGGLTAAVKGLASSFGPFAVGGSVAGAIGYFVKGLKDAKEQIDLINKGIDGLTAAQLEEKLAGLEKEKAKLEKLISQGDEGLFVDTSYSEERLKKVNKQIKETRQALADLKEETSPETPAMDNDGGEETGGNVETFNQELSAYEKAMNEFQHKMATGGMPLEDELTSLNDIYSEMKQNQQALNEGLIKPEDINMNEDEIQNALVELEEKIFSKKEQIATNYYNSVIDEEQRMLKQGQNNTENMINTYQTMLNKIEGDERLSYDTREQLKQQFNDRILQLELQRESGIEQLNEQLGQKYKKLSDEKTAYAVNALEKEREAVKQSYLEQLGHGEEYNKKAKEIDELYNRLILQAQKEHAKKLEKEQDRIMEYKYKSNRISLKEYKAYLKERLQQFDEYSQEHIKIKQKLDNLEVTPGEVETEYSDQLETLKQKNKAYGESFDFVAQKTQLVKSTLDRLITTGNTDSELFAELSELYNNMTSNDGGEAESLNWMTDAFVDMGVEIEIANKKFKDWKKDITNGLSNAIARGEDFGDVLESIGDQIAAMAIKQAIVQPIVDWAFPTSHEGSYVSPEGLIQDLPRFHSGGNVRGIKNDEVPAVLQTGERVLSREQNAAFEAGMPGGGNYQITINAVDSQSFIQAVQRNPEAIVSVVTQDIMRNGNTRKAIKKS